MQEIEDLFHRCYLYLLGYRDDLSLGKCFHHGWHVKKDLVRARSYYLKAARQNNIAAFVQLQALAEEEGRMDEADYYLGREHECLGEWQKAFQAYQGAGEAGYALGFYRSGLLVSQDRTAATPSQTINKNLEAELYWYKEAAARNCIYALDALLSLSEKEEKATLHLAELYEKGKIGNEQILSRAVEYYEKAYRMGSAIAAYRLGQLYEKGKIDNKKILSRAIEYYEKAYEMGYAIAAYRLGQLYEKGEENFLPNLQKACTYYLTAAKKQDKKALRCLEGIVKNLQDANLQLQLAEVYENHFHKKEKALAGYKILADQGNQVALVRLMNLAESDANHAYALARSYVNNSKTREKAYPYYVAAMQNKHEVARKELIFIAESGDAKAQYALGCFYFDQQDSFTEAIHWCLLAAEQQHTEAADCLHNKSFPSQYYLSLGKIYMFGRYRQEIKINPNKDKARYFFEKALENKNKDAAFFLGQSYQFDNPEKAFDYFLKAAEWEPVKALISLEQLASEMGPDRQLQLSNFFKTSPINNEGKALHFLKKAIQGTPLRELNLSDERIQKVLETKQAIDLQTLTQMFQQPTQQERGGFFTLSK